MPAKPGELTRLLYFLIVIKSYAVQYGHMIDNVVLIVTGTLHERDVQVRLLVMCCPVLAGPSWCSSSGCMCLGAIGSSAAVALGRGSQQAAGVWHTSSACREAPVLLMLQELLEKCNPLGMFDAIASLAVAQNMRDLYRLVRAVVCAHWDWPTLAAVLCYARAPCFRRGSLHV